MQEDKRWKLKDIPRMLGRILVAILQGRLMIKLDIGRYMIHILYCFALIGLAIYLSLLIDASMREVEENKAVLAGQKEEITILSYEIEKAGSKAEITYKLEKTGSSVTRPEKPATRIR